MAPWNGPKNGVLAGAGTESAGGSVVPTGRRRLLCTNGAFYSTGPGWRLLRTTAADESLVSLVAANSSSPDDGQLRSVSFYADFIALLVSLTILLCYMVFFS